MKRFIALWLFVTSCCAIFGQARKAVSILGDSYSTYQDYVEPDTNKCWYLPHSARQNDVKSVSQTWWYQFIHENGYRLCVNNSFSGSTICHTGYDCKDYSDRSFVTRMNQLGCPDIILIFGGTNDSWAGVPMGQYQYADWTSRDLYQFRPALAYMFDHLHYRYPNVEIYFMLNSELSTEINESVRTVCAHYHIPCLELKDIEKQSGHPSVKGMEQISEQLRAFIARQPVTALRP